VGRGEARKPRGELGTAARVNWDQGANCLLAELIMRRNRGMDVALIKGELTRRCICTHARLYSGCVKLVDLRLVRSLGGSKTVSIRLVELLGGKGVCNSRTAGLDGKPTVRESGLRGD